MITAVPAPKYYSMLKNNKKISLKHKQNVKPIYL
jgi:hypothetical protein